MANESWTVLATLQAKDEISPVLQNLVANLTQAQASIDSTTASLAKIGSGNAAPAIKATTTALQDQINALAGVSNANKSASASAAVFERALGTQATSAMKLRELMGESGEAMQGLGVKTAQTRETFVLLHEAATGRFSRIPGSLLVMGEYMGGLSLATVGWGVAIGATGLVVYELVKAWMATEAAVKSATGAMIVSGQAGTDTEGKVRGWISDLKGFWNETSAEAQKSTEALAQIGGAATQFRDRIKEAAAAQATLGDGDPAKVTEEVAHAFDGGAASALRWATAHHVLGEAQRENIENLIKQGADSKAMSAVLDAMQTRYAATGKALAQYNAEMKSYVQIMIATNGAANIPVPQKPSMTSGAPAANPVDEEQDKTVYETNAALNERVAIYGKLAEVQAAEDRGVAGSAEAQAALWRQLAGVHTASEIATHEKVLADLQEQLVYAKDNADQRVAIEKKIADATAAYDGASSTAARSASVAVVQAEQAAADRRLQIRMSELSGEEAAAKNDYNKQADIINQRLALLRQAGKQGTDEYQNELNRQTDLAHQHQQQLNEIALSDADTQNEVAKIGIEAKRDELDTEVQAGLVTNQQKITMEKQYQDQIYALELDNLEKRLKIADLTVTEQDKINNEILVLQAQHNADMAKLDDQLQIARKKDDTTEISAWKDVTKEIESSEGQLVQNVLSGRGSMTQGLISMGSNLLQTELTNDLKYFTMRELYSALGMQDEADNLKGGLLIHLFTEESKTAATQAGAVQRVVADTTAAETTKVVNATTAQSDIMTKAGQAAAGAYEATVGIPIVGPILAPAAAGVAFAAVEAFGSNITSAAGGWDNVPVDGAMAQLHKNEMVLSAKYAGPLRNMLASNQNTTTTGWGLKGTPASQSLAKSVAEGAGGGGGGTTHVYNFPPIAIQSLDPSSAADAITSNYPAVMTAVGKAVRANLHTQNPALRRAFK